MTIREHMNRKKRRFNNLTLAGFAIFLISLLLSTLFGGEVACVVLFVFIGFLLLVFYSHELAFECPRCQGPWHILTSQTSVFPFSIDRRIRYCPFCAADIDAKDGAKPPRETADLLA